MFKDIVSAKLVAGKGGNGRVAFKSIASKKRSDGGNGGNGGDFYVMGDSNLYDLSFINKDQVFKADDGIIGGVNNSTGANAKDYILKLPIATNIYNQEGELIARVQENNQKILLLKGGVGGKGNLAFKRGGVDSLYEFTEGSSGESLNAKLELELMSDVIFIGLPNAGKSSLLNALTNANAKVAPYAFTTTIPKLGRMGSITLMDLPGLIEKTFEGKGLGTSFVKHTKSAKLLLHVISLENEDILNAYKTIRTEIKNIDNRLYNLKEVIVLSKLDNVDSKKITESLNILKSVNNNCIATSIIDENSLREVEILISTSLK